MLSTIYLREVASSPSTSLLLYDQYEFDSIQRIKIRHGHPYYLVKWKRGTQGLNSSISSKKPVAEGETSSEVVLLDEDEEDDAVVCESSELLDEPDVPQVLTDDGCCFLLTDEDIQLVSSAFPKETTRFQEQQVGNGCFLCYDNFKICMTLADNFNLRVIVLALIFL